MRTITRSDVEQVLAHTLAEPKSTTRYNPVTGLDRDTRGWLVDWQRYAPARVRYVPGTLSVAYNPDPTHTKRRHCLNTAAAALTGAGFQIRREDDAIVVIGRHHGD